MAKIAVIGPGAVGSTITAWLMQDATNSVVVAARTPLSDIEVQTPERLLRVAPGIITRVNDASPVNWVLVTTKAYDAEDAGAWFGPGATI